MHCAQLYIITVTPSSNQCIGLDSNPYPYIAGNQAGKASQEPLMQFLLDYVVLLPVHFL